MFLLIYYLSKYMFDVKKMGYGGVRMILDQQ